MALTNSYVLPINRIPDLFRKIQDGQAPERFTIQLLRDWGFSSTNDRAFVPLLKALGFLTADGKPTQRYLDYRDHSRSKLVLGQGVREGPSWRYSPADGEIEIKGALIESNRHEHIPVS